MPTNEVLAHKSAQRYAVYLDMVRSRSAHPG